ncbi:MAG: subtype B tannase, partial [Bilifractor sp.]
DDRNYTFDANKYSVEEKSIAGLTIRYRAFRNLIYVKKPVNPEFQQMNLFAPEAYFEGKALNGWDKDSAPVFVPNTVGGYMPGPLDEPGADPRRKQAGEPTPNTIFLALQHGYVVAVPAIRGRVQKDNSGHYTGKAPACIVDYKAAIRYLHYYAEQLPGDEDKIITNGTSAGGAISALMGVSGDHPDYESYLAMIGAADASDRIFAASCYCPITNLDHADMAYEWEFGNETEYHRAHMEMDAGGRPHFTPVDGVMTPEQIDVSKRLRALFPAYLNSLALKDDTGALLTLSDNGTGSFLDYMKSIVLASAQSALDKGIDLSDQTWLTVRNGIAEAMNWNSYVHDITRMKEAPAFDGLHMETPETSLFGDMTTDCRHFTRFSSENGEDPICAPENLIRLLNPMNYIGDPKACPAKYFRIRHGEKDRDTSLAISAILTLKLRENGIDTDYASPWDTPHAGDYDLPELFSWIDKICRDN